MDVILDANAYIAVLHNHGRRFLETNQFAELLIYLRRTGSRLVIPEMTYNEVVARYGERLTAIAKAARDAWSTLQQVGMQERIDFLEPDIKSELAALGELLRHPAQGVQILRYTDYSGVDLKQVVRRGIGRVRPANDKGEELRDVILWLIVLHYAKRSKARIAFISNDKMFQHTDGTLHPTLQWDIEQAGVSIAFYRSVGDFIKANALESEPLERDPLAAYVGDEELRRFATEQLLGSRFWNGTIVGAEVSQCELAEARRYRVADDSYYVEARYTGEGTIRIVQSATVTTRVNLTKGSATPTVTEVTTVAGTAPFIQDEVSLPEEATKVILGLPPYTGYNVVRGVPWVTEPAENPYRCRFSIRLSLRIVADKLESLEVDEFVLLGELVPIATGST